MQERVLTKQMTHFATVECDIGFEEDMGKLIADEMKNVGRKKLEGKIEREREVKEKRDHLGI